MGCVIIGMCYDAAQDARDSLRTVSHGMFFYEHVDASHANTGLKIVVFRHDVFHAERGYGDVGLRVASHIIDLGLDLMDVEV